VAFGVLHEITSYFINKILEIKKLVVTLLISFKKFISHLNTTTMSKYFKLRSLPFFLFVFFLMSSCANDDKAATNTTTQASTSTPASTDVTPATTTPTNGRLPAEGTLDKIWIEAAEFSGLRNARLVFSFAIDDPGFLTLHGWSCQRDGSGNCTGAYDHDPNLKLKKGQPSGVGYGPIVFWENVILGKEDVRNIKAQIGAYHYVLFVPKNKNGHISYSIILSDRDPTNFSATADLPDFPTEIDANPSPPKNSSN
jgi:hypothetical protein